MGRAIKREGKRARVAESGRWADGRAGGHASELVVCWTNGCRDWTAGWVDGSGPC